MYPVEDNSNWMEFYPDVGEKIPNDLPLEKGPIFGMTDYVVGVALDGPALMLGDNMPVVLNTTVPSSALKKKHDAIAYR
jgi:hypothetical protein